MSDAALAPFWAKAEQLGALIVIHPNGFSDAARFYFNNVIGNPLETALALHYLIFGGVLERYPNLKILVAHGGEYLGSYCGRMDHTGGRDETAIAVCPTRRRIISRRSSWIGSFYASAQRIDQGVRRRSSSHGHRCMGEFDPIGHVGSVEQLSDATVAAIAGGNARRAGDLRIIPTWIGGFARRSRRLG